MLSGCVGGSGDSFWIACVADGGAVSGSCGADVASFGACWDGDTLIRARLGELGEREDCRRLRVGALGEGGASGGTTDEATVDSAIVRLCCATLAASVGGERTMDRYRVSVDVDECGCG